MFIDTHTHIYPTLDERLKLAGLDVSLPKIKGAKLLKSLAKGPQSKVNKLLQSAAPMIRSLPKEAQAYADKLHGAASLGGTISHSSTEDLLESMDKNGIASSIVIAHPPLISNEFVLAACENEKRLYPVVNIPKGEADPQDLLKSYIARGAVALKIHAAADGFKSDDPHYLGLLEVANQAKLPVIIHTGCIHVQPFYKDPEMGHAQRFVHWFSDYSDINFILAHMNYHYPEKAIEFCEKFENVFCDCSWQPSAVIEEALGRIPEKIMFGTDWPIVGSNQEVMMKRVKSLKTEKKLEERLAYLTAKKIFNL